VALLPPSGLVLFNSATLYLSPSPTSAPAPLRPPQAVCPGRQCPGARAQPLQLPSISRILVIRQPAVDNPANVAMAGDGRSEAPPPQAAPLVLLVTFSDDLRPVKTTCGRSPCSTPSLQPGSWGKSSKRSFFFHFIGGWTEFMFVLIRGLVELLVCNLKHGEWMVAYANCEPDITTYSLRYLLL
jgi:hypothetical protein